MSKRERFNFMLEPEQVRMLKMLSASLDKSISDLTEEAINLLFDKHKEAVKGFQSVLDGMDGKREGNG